MLITHSSSKWKSNIQQNIHLWHWFGSFVPVLKQCNLACNVLSTTIRINVKYCHQSKCSLTRWFHEKIKSISNMELLLLGASGSADFKLEEADSYTLKYLSKFPYLCRHIVCDGKSSPHWHPFRRSQAQPALWNCEIGYLWRKKNSCQQGQE